MRTVKQLQEERAPISVEIRTLSDRINAESRAFTAEEQAKWDRLNTDFNRMSAQIEAARVAQNVTEEMGRRSSNIPGLEDTVPRGKAGRSHRVEVAEEYRALALQAWCRRQHGFELNEDHKRACKAVGLNPNRRVLDVQLARRPNAELSKAQKRAMSAINPATGAYTIAEGFSNNFEKALKDYNGPRQVADIMRTSDGATMPWPTSDDTVNEGEIIGENTAVNEKDVAVGVTNFHAYKYTSKMVKVPNELLEDSAFDLGAELGMMLGERIGRAQSRHFTTGTGQSQPSGIVTGSKLGKQATSPTAIMADDIIDLIHSVDPAYRRDPSFRLMFHDQILAIIRKLKDGQGRYLFEEGQDGAPDKIKGVRIVINQNMDDTVAAGKKTMLAGAFRKFKIRDVRGLRMKRLEERYAELDQVAFVAFMRSDSKLLDAGGGPVKHMAH